MHSLRCVCLLFGSSAGGGFGGCFVGLLGRFLALFFVDLGHRPQQAFGQFLQFFVFRVDRRARFGPRCCTGSGGRSVCGFGRCRCRTGWLFGRGRRRWLGGWCCHSRWRHRRRCGWGDHGCVRRGGLGRCRVCVGRVARCWRCSRGGGSRHHGCRWRREWGRWRAACGRRCSGLSASARFGLGLGVCFGPLCHGAWARACGSRRRCGGACRAGAGWLAWRHGRCCPLHGCALRSSIRIKLRADVRAYARQVNGAACHRYINGHRHRRRGWRRGCGWCRRIGGQCTHGHVREQQP